MSEEIKSEAISRRKALSFLGLAAVLALAGPMVLTASDTEAQEHKGRREQRQERRKGTQS